MDGEQNKSGEAEAYNQFPRKAMWFYIGVIIFSALAGLLTDGVEVDPETGLGMSAVVILVSLLLGSLGVFAFAMIQYALIKIPTQWIAKDEEVYKNDIWAALFYSNAIGMLMSVLANQLGHGENVLLAAINAVVITVLFLYFYFYGTNKPAHIKRAIIIVQVLWMLLSLAFSAVAYQYL
ncbi:MAG: hypothetical protein JJU01_05470 [Alkalibacterium sp.]|nr:hypothetical protein [Alkalibacterium sp.]TVP89470.1 MAG: hypothetical protein EA249_09475 [Alkalibacterium sp.]